MKKEQIASIIQVVSEMQREPLTEDQIDYLEFILEPLTLDPKHGGSSLDFQEVWLVEVRTIDDVTPDTLMYVASSQEEALKYINSFKDEPKEDYADGQWYWAISREPVNVDTTEDCGVLPIDWTNMLAFYTPDAEEVKDTGKVREYWRAYASEKKNTKGR